MKGNGDMKQTSCRMRLIQQRSGTVQHLNRGIDQGNAARGDPTKKNPVEIIKALVLSVSLHRIILRSWAASVFTHPPLAATALTPARRLQRSLSRIQERVCRRTQRPESHGALHGLARIAGRELQLSLATEYKRYKDHRNEGKAVSGPPSPSALGRGRDLGHPRRRR